MIGYLEDRGFKDGDIVIPILHKINFSLYEENTLYQIKFHPERGHLYVYGPNDVRLIDGRKGDSVDWALADALSKEDVL